MLKKLAKWLCPTKEGQKGAVNIGGTLMMGIGMVFLAVGFILFPIVTDATDDLLAYTYTNVGATENYTDASFTGFTAVIGITPLLVLLGFLSAAVFAMFLGVKISKGAAGGTSLNLGSIILLGLSMVFIAVGLIIMPVALDGICSVLQGASPGYTGINAAYTGLEPILLVTPLLLLISFISATVISGFFGIKKLGGGGD